MVTFFELKVLALSPGSEGNITCVTILTSKVVGPLFTFSLAALQVGHPLIRPLLERLFSPCLGPFFLFVRGVGGRRTTPLDALMVKGLFSKSVDFVVPLFAPLLSARVVFSMLLAVGSHHVLLKFLAPDLAPTTL
jgi:hypothetical protein